MTETRKAKVRVQRPSGAHWLEGFVVAPVETLAFISAGTG